MEIRKVESWEIVTSKGVRVSPVTEKKARALMATFQKARILGANTEVTELQAIRMATAVLNSWNVSQK